MGARVAANKKRVRWKGELAKPIRPCVVRPKGLAITDPETVAKANEEMIRLEKEAVAQKCRQKLGLLMEHYSIDDKNDWFGLALALAVDHIPGFQVHSRLVEFGVDWKGDSPSRFSGPVVIEQKKVGRRKTWAFDRLDQLLNAVEQRKAKDGIKTDREALSRLVQREEWAPPATHRGGSKNGLRLWRADCRTQRGGDA